MSKKTISDLVANDYIAFGFDYYGGEPTEIIVAPITSIHRELYLVHFLYGYKSMAEYVKVDNILAIGNPSGLAKIKGWSGKFDILQSEHKLLTENNIYITLSQEASTLLELSKKLNTVIITNSQRKQ